MKFGETVLGDNAHHLTDPGFDMTSKLAPAYMPGWLILMGALTAIAPVSIDMYLPTFHLIAQDFQVSSGDVERTLAIYLFGMAISQLLYGPLADRFGRKPPLLGGLTLYILASIGCALAPNIQVLTLCRLFQAMGGAAGLVVPRAVIRDHYDTQQAARALSLLMLIMGVAPILAPIMGGQLLDLVGWRGIFGAMVLGSVALILTVTRVMTESLNPKNITSLHLATIFRTYINLLSSPRFVAFAVSGGMISAAMFSYIASSPRIFIQHFNVAPQHYGMLFGLNAVCLIIGSQISARLLKTRSPISILPLALTGAAVAGVTALILTLTGLITLPLLMVCLMTFMFSMGFVGPNSAAMALADQGKHLGSASAMLGTLQMSCGAIAGATVSLLPWEGPLPLVLMLATCTSLGWSIGLIARGT